MLKPLWIVTAALISFSALGEVSFEEKKNRVEYLEELSSGALSMNIEAYQRELEYEKQNLSLERRAENEANLLAEKIKVQVQKAFEAALAKKSSEEAAQEVKDAIEKDLELVAPELKEEIREISLNALENIQNGIMSSEVKLEEVENVMLKSVTDRSLFLNSESELEQQVSMLSSGHDFQRKDYSSKKAVLESLVSNRENAPFVTTGSMTLRSDNVIRGATRISLQVKVKFLGVALEAGPSIIFSRDFKTNVSVIAEGLNPVLLPDGNFDFSLTQNKRKRRLINFQCDATLGFESDYSGAGGFSVMGMGSTHSVTKRYINSVNLLSRRIALPESIDGKIVTFRYLNELCHDDFLKARITSNMTVTDSLNVMMKNVVAGLQFSHPKTKCATDNHCLKWLRKDVLSLQKTKNVARCVENKKEKFSACELRGLQGQSCPVFNAKGKRISSGQSEFKCDAGLKCVTVQQASWFKAARGRCMPVNAKK